MPEAKGKTRDKYDGSYPPRVNPDSIDTIERYGISHNRLGIRLDCLVKEYQEIESKFNETDDLGKKVEILNERDTMEEQIQGVLDTKSALEARRSEIEEKERASIENATFKNYEF